MGRALPQPMHARAPTQPDGVHEGVRGGVDDACKVLERGPGEGGGAGRRTGSACARRRGRTPRPPVRKPRRKPVPNMCVRARTDNHARTHARTHAHTAQHTHAHNARSCSRPDPSPHEHVLSRDHDAEPALVHVGALQVDRADGQLQDVRQHVQAGGVGVEGVGVWGGRGG